MTDHGSPTELLWFRQDLRLAGNPALAAALARGGPLIPVYIHAPEEEGDWPPGAASCWWLAGSLAALDADLRARGSRLTVLRGPTADALRRLAAMTGATAVSWNRRYEPAAAARDAALATSLPADGLHVRIHAAALLAEPWTVATQAGRPFQVFTPFWRAQLRQLDPPLPDPAPEWIPGPEDWPATLPLDSLGLLPVVPWDRAMRACWQPGESGAHAALERFLATAFAGYGEGRDRPAENGTSRLSPHLHWGEISPAQVWHAAAEAAARQGQGPQDWRASPFITELGWREFAYHLLHHFPHTPAQPLRPEFARFPWAEDPAALEAWRRGRTGIPLVDAGMRQLWATGWMHNRVRMVVASFLVKQLRQPWQEGARWFWDTLVDADLAANSLGWQWSAGSGADAAPYFRIFNPVTQGRRFDPDGSYVKRWLPELLDLPEAIIHAPWTSPLGAKAAYPEPIVDLGAARRAALAAYGVMRGGRSS